MRDQFSVTPYKFHSFDMFRIICAYSKEKNVYDKCINVYSKMSLVKKKLLI